GVGLIVGSFIGRSRGPIWLGILLVFALMLNSAAGQFKGDQVFKPTTMADLQPEYNAHLASVTLDLRQLDFVRQNRPVNISLSVGKILVQLPPKVDVIVHVHIGAGDAKLFGVDKSDTNLRTTASDNDKDGPGGGQLVINADIKYVGQVEVDR